MASTKKIQTTQRNVPAGMIDLGIGQPGLDILPTAVIRRATFQRLHEDDPEIIQYGAEQGDGYLRQALAHFLAQSYGEMVDPDWLFISNGVSQALDLVCTVFSQPGDVIFVEEPSYFLAFQIFADHHLKIVGIPTDEQGIIVEALEAELRRVRPRLLYTIPAFQNPTGATLPLQRRQRLVELSQEYNFLIAADEVYHLLAYPMGTQMSMPPTFGSFAAAETVLSLGTFSKILTPGLRIGWVQAAPHLVQRLVTSGLVGSGGGLNPFAAAVVRTVIEMGLQQEYLSFLHATFAERIEVMDRALHHHLGQVATWTKPQGGYFFWLRFFESVDTTPWLAAAQLHQAGFQPGVRFSSQGALRNFLRLSFAYYPSAALEAGVARLKQAIGDGIERLRD